MSAAVLTTMLVLFGSIYDQRFDDANAAFDAGDYTKAASYYEELIAEQVVSSKLFYNLGNSYYRQSKLGFAIANYERALRIEPGFDDARVNLMACVRQTKRHLERPLPPDWEQSLLFWHYDLKPSTTRLLAVVLWIVMWAMLGVLQWRRIRYMRTVSLVVAVVALGFSGSAWVKAHPAVLAVASEQVVPVRYGTNEEETIRFELFDGDRVTVDKCTEDWARVTTVSGERGWARKAGLVFVGPPYVSQSFSHTELSAQPDSPSQEPG